MKLTRNQSYLLSSCGKEVKVGNNVYIYIPAYFKKTAPDKYEQIAYDAVMQTMHEHLLKLKENGNKETR